MATSITNEGPQFSGGNLSQWAVGDRLPWLVDHLGLTAGAICSSVPANIRRKVLGLGDRAQLPSAIDWSRNGVVISPPGTGKGMAVFVEALAHFERVIVLVPSVIQAHKLEQSIDTLYHHEVGGCMTSQRKSPGLITVITTGIFHQMVKDKKSSLWKEGTVLIVDEAQRILEQDLLTEFMIGYAAHKGVRTMIISATIAPGTLPEVYGTPTEGSALVYDLERQMHEVEISQLPANVGEEMEVLAKTGALNDAGKTTLVFISSRRGVMSVTKRLRAMRSREVDPISAHVVPVTGNHMVEDQLHLIKRAQETGDPVVVVATPGTMDSSVTIPGLSLVVIIDRRIRVDWNQYGVRERFAETLPINHIWQMIRRVGRQERTDGKKDQVIVLGPRRTDILAETPVFEPITGCSPWTPLEDLLLAAVLLDVPFKDIHEHMVSTFSDERIASTTQGLLDTGMIRHVDDPSDADGFELTEKGQLVASMPFSYKWARLIVEAPSEMMPQLTLLASFGYLDDLEMFEWDENDVEEDKDASEMLAKLGLGIEYIETHHDHAQYAFARSLDLSFRRLEQMETLFELGCQALDLPFKEPLMPSASAERDLLAYLVEGGLKVGLFQLFFPGKGEGRSWSDPRKTGDGELRRFFFPAERLTLAEHAEGGTVAVVGTATWFTSGRGAPMGNVNDVTIVPQHMVAGLVAETAEREGWFKMTFAQGAHRGALEFYAIKDGKRHVASLMDAEPTPDVEYWVSVDRALTSRVTSVIVHYPVLES